MATNLRAQLEDFEGRRRSAYPDSLGYMTIGVGRLIDARRNGGLSEEEIDYLLTNDINRVTEQLNSTLPWFKNLNEPRQAVLIGMAFQMGVAGLMEFQRTLASIRDEHWELAASQMLDSRWAKQTAMRASRLARQIATGDWQ